MSQTDPILHFDLEDNTTSKSYTLDGSRIKYTDGIKGRGILLNDAKSLSIDDLYLTDSASFSIQFWMKTTSSQPMVLIAQKRFENKGIKSQKNPGWVLYASNGTLGWNVGSGERRLTYERDNGEKYPISDGSWHLVTMTYDKEQSILALFLDGRQLAQYKVHFGFESDESFQIGSKSSEPESSNLKYEYSREIEAGKILLQNFVNAFNQIGKGELEDDEFIDLIVDPESVLKTRLSGDAILDSLKPQLNGALAARRLLLDNEYTVFQNRALTEIKPVSKVYYLNDGTVSINHDAAKAFTENEKLFTADFALDELSVWNRPLSAEEVNMTYTGAVGIEGQSNEPHEKLDSLTVGVWNIWHGGIHWTKEKDGWDSRIRIAEMIKANSIDIVLMQETYSSGDFIAAELGYYFATTSDWDYRFQGANISVLSRFPINELQVLPETEFNNVAAKLQISQTQELWAISNWYGMQQFLAVAEFHSSKFLDSENYPILFGGDFNAIPHTDGGDSPASTWLAEHGFTDAYRSYYQDSDKYPGYTHRSGSRIDQLYFKGDSLSHDFTKVITTWPGGFPSDHYLIVSKFYLNK